MISRGPLAGERGIVTVEQHIADQQHRHPHATGEFTWLLSGITLATKMIQAKVRRAGLTDLLGSADATNVQGERQQKLDVYANNLLLHVLGLRDTVGVLVSEENEEPVTLRERGAHARYAVVFDPLDGSSNIDVNVSVGTIFSILRLPANSKEEPVTRQVLQPGANQVAAGYVVYGSSTILVYTAGAGVFGFTLDPAVGAFLLSHENLRIPEQGPYYSCNEANAEDFPPVYRDYLQRLRTGQLGGKYSSRYIGSLVADFHRTLVRGGVFLYPPTIRHAEGKLRLLYEANPIAFLAEQAGGKASDGAGRVLDIEPRSIHQRTPLIVGGAHEMNAFVEMVQSSRFAAPPLA